MQSKGHASDWDSEADQVSSIGMQSTGGGRKVSAGFWMHLQRAAPRLGVEVEDYWHAGDIAL